MSIEQAEKLKRELTDKWVVVAEDTPELRRFAALTGKVKTVNMNCRALVEFDGPEDISWYDIDPQFLTVVDVPRPKAEEKAETKPSAAAGTKKKATAAAGGSPLDRIRASSGDTKPAAGGSPLDKIRAAAAAQPTKERAAETPDTPAAKPEEKKAATGSPLEQIRAQGAFKG